MAPPNLVACPSHVLACCMEFSSHGKLLILVDVSTGTVHGESNEVKVYSVFCNSTP